MGKVQHR